MSKSSGVVKTVGYAFGAAIAASLIVLVIGICMFGFQLTQWTEWEGRAVGVAGTIAGVAGAVVGLRLAMRGEERGIK